MIDIHAHLDQYPDPIEALAAELEELQIFTVANSMDPASYARNVRIAEQTELVLPIFGIHPWKATEWADRLDELQELIMETPLLGEIGLDFHFRKDRSEYPAQIKVFEHFLAAAARHDKPVIVHAKGAEAEVLERLTAFDIRRAVLHWYVGPMDILQRLLERGAYFSLGPELLFSESIRDQARAIPLERVLTETDNPGAYEWLQGEPGRPELLSRITRALAELKGITPAELDNVIQSNFLELLAGDTSLGLDALDRLQTGGPEEG